MKLNFTPNMVEKPITLEFHNTKGYTSGTPPRDMEGEKKRELSKYTM